MDDSHLSYLEGLDQGLFQLSFKEAKEKMNRIFHRQYMRERLRENHGNISHAANAAGIQRQYFHRLMKEEHIHAEEFRLKTKTIHTGGVTGGASGDDREGITDHN